jgi:hypothetical protein
MLLHLPIFSQLPLSNPITMILQERQECLNTVFHDIESMNRRRAFVSTKYVLAHEQFDRTFSEADKKEIEKYKTELDNIDQQVMPLYRRLRDIQTRYLVEYEGELVDPLTGKPSLNRYKEELYFLLNCEIDTFNNGWNLEQCHSQELLYEIADFLLQHRFSKFFIRNIKKL